MSKHVVVVASGDTERRALPHLLSYLVRDDMTVDIRTPSGHRPLRVDIVEKIIRAAWFTSHPGPPTKFVVLLDVDQSSPENVLAPLQEQLLQRVGSLSADILFAYAQQHLESWFFADISNLRQYLGRSPGDVDTSRPDAIQNPKQHLIHLLGRRVYTARTSEEIARRLDGQVIEQRSPSFRGLVKALRNGS